MFEQLIGKLTGLDGIESVSEAIWELRHPWPPIVLVGMIAAAGIFSIVSYRRFANRGPWARGAMSVLRALVLVLALTILFEPVLQLDLSRRTNNKILVLLDTSESMSIRDKRESAEEIREAAVALGAAPEQDLTARQSARAADASRLELATSILTNAVSGLLSQIEDGFDVHLAHFDEVLSPLASGEAEAGLQELKAQGRASALGTAMQKSAAGYGGQPLAGMIILSDFAWNQGSDPLAVARELKDNSVPIYPIGVGLVDPPDIAVVRLYTKQTLFAGDPYSVKVQIRSSPGFSRAAAQVDLTAGPVKETRIVTLTGGLQVEEFELTAPKESGRYSLDVEVSAAGDEAVTENNSDSRQITVTDEKIRVLYVEGLPRWEYRFLRWVLMRDHRLDVKFLLTHGDAELAVHSPYYLYRFPEAGREGLDFDLVIIGDVAPTFFNSQQIRWIEHLVKRRGGSLMMISGTQHAPSAYRGTPIADLLPVRVHDAPWMRVGQLEMPVVTAEGHASGIVRLSDTASETADIWRRMRPLSAIPPVSAKPAATILMALSSHKNDGDRYPFLSWHRYGNGKTLFVASDKLWRIRYKVGRKHHERFWAQTIQFLALSRLMAGNSRVALETDRQSYGIGEPCRVFANVLDPLLEPVIADDYTVHVEKSDDAETTQTVRLTPVHEIPGFYEGTVMLSDRGAYRVLAAESDRDFANSPTFNVEAVSIEMRNPGMRIETARQLAQISQGFAIMSMDDLPRLTQTIRARSPLRVEHAEIELWDTPFVFLVILVAAALEWIIRRKKRLV